MDYRKLLGKTEEHVLPYFGGRWVQSATRRFSVEGDVDQGWWRFEVRGRKATAQERVDAPALDELPKSMGHLLDARTLVREGAFTEELHLVPEEEPPLFSPAVVRRWHSGHLLFDALEFESDAEESVRRALEEDRDLGDLKGVPATLRAAYAYALVQRVGHELGIAVQPIEVRARLAELTSGGREAAVAELQRLQEVRAAERQRRQDAPLDWRALRDRAAPDQTLVRIEEALDAVEARLLRSRRLEGGLMEITYSFMGSRFATVVQADTLGVVDAGVCLGHDGEDELMTLDSLPGAIREAIELGILVYTRTPEDVD